MIYLAVICFVLLLYSYAGFPLLILLLARVRPRPWKTDETTRPTVSILLPVFNEELILRRCLSALVDQRYPSERIEILCGSDGSTEAFGAFIAGQAVLACDRADRAIIGDRYKVPRLVAEQITASAMLVGNTCPKWESQRLEAAWSSLNKASSALAKAIGANATRTPNQPTHLPHDCSGLARQALYCRRPC